MSNIQKTSDLKGLMNKPQVQERLKEILGKNHATFATSVMQIAQSNDMLKKAEPQSILGAAMTAATLNLPLNNSLGFAYIVPFYDGKTKTTKAQFQIGAKGFKQLASRSGQFKVLNETDVREGEIEHRDRLTGEIKFNFVQDDKERQKLKVIGYVSHFKLTNGFESTLYMTVEELENHAKKYSQTYKKGFGTWKDNFDAMAKKTVSKLNLSKNAPLSIEMQTAVTSDQAVVNETEDVDYVDNAEEAEELRPSLDDAEFKQAIDQIKAGDITAQQLEEMYELSEKQIKEAYDVKN